MKFKYRTGIDLIESLFDLAHHWSFVKICTC